MAIEDHNIHSHAASHQKLVREQILAILSVATLDRAINITIVFIEHVLKALLNSRKEVCTY